MQLRRRHYYVFAAVVFCWVVYLLVAVRSQDLAEPPQPAPVAVVAHPQAVESSRTEMAAQDAASEKLRQERVQDLARMEKEQSQRARAVTGTKLSRYNLRFDHQGAWEKYVSANLPAFLALRLEAAQSPDKKVQCTICNGRGEMNFCIICNGDGKCPACHGTGKISAEDLCPACTGNGKCFFVLAPAKCPAPFVTMAPSVPTAAPAQMMRAI